MSNDPPNNLRYSKQDATKYKELTSDDLSPFQGMPYKDVLVYAAAYGFRNGLREPLEKPQPNIPFTALKDRDIWLLKAIAVAEEDSLSVLRNESDLYRVPEEYANGAIEELYREVLAGKPGDPLERMSQEVLDMINEDDI
jgi:dnd system-associated protein 4